MGVAFYREVLGVADDQAHNFWLRLFADIGCISEVFHTSLLELLEAPITYLQDFMPLIINGRNSLRAMNK